MHLALLGSQINVYGTRVASHNVELYPEGVFQQLREIVISAAGSYSAAPRRLRGLANIFNRLEGSIRANVDHLTGALRSTNPAKSSPVEVDLLSSNELIEIK